LTHNVQNNIKNIFFLQFFATPFSKFNLTIHSS
jgi:hypothetical protein